MRHDLVGAPLLAAYALSILPFAGATTIRTFSDARCRTLSDTITVEDSPGSGACRKVPADVTSFMLGTLGPDCTVTVYGHDSEDSICSANNNTLAEESVCYNSTWIYFSVDGCRAPSSSSSTLTPTTLTTSTTTPTTTPTTTSEPDPAGGVNVGAVVGGVISGVFVVALLAGMAFYFFSFRPRQRRDMAGLIATRSDASAVGFHDPYDGGGTYTATATAATTTPATAGATMTPATRDGSYAGGGDPYAKPAAYGYFPRGYGRGSPEVYELSPQYIAEVHEQTQTRHELPP